MVSEMNADKVRVQPSYNWLFLSAFQRLRRGATSQARYLGGTSSGLFGSTLPGKPRTHARPQPG